MAIKLGRHDNNGVFVGGQSKASHTHREHSRWHVHRMHEQTTTTRISTHVSKYWNSLYTGFL